MPRLHSYCWLLLLVGCGGDKTTCDPTAQTGCDSGKVCENVAGADPKCFAPVEIQGRVFDLGDNSGIANARVVAVDVDGAAVSNVVKTSSDGSYKLPIPTDRNADGTPVSLAQTVTLRADAEKYESFPGTVRQPLPIDMSTAVDSNGTYTVKSSQTDIAMLDLAGAGGTGSIEGKVELPDDTTGAVVVAESNGIGYPAIVARNGEYAILNLPAGDYAVNAYAVDHNYAAATTTVAAATVKLDLKLSADAPSDVSGNVSIVDPGTGTATSVVLFIESTYDKTTGRGVTVPGLRAPRTGAPDVTGAFTINGVPAGKYVVVAAFDNDGFVRDPDLCIAGTADVHIAVDAATPLAIPDQFKITGALEVMDPGANGATAVTGSPTFKWVDDSGEDQYLVELFDSYGQLTWMKTMPGVSGGQPAMLYDGPALQQGMYYQFRVTSSAQNGGTTAQRCALSRTEDLKGVFYLP